MKVRRPTGIISAIFVVIIVLIIVVILKFADKGKTVVGEEETTSVSNSIFEESKVDLPKAEIKEEAEEKTGEQEKSGEKTIDDLKEVYSSLYFDKLPEEICEVFRSGREFVRSETGDRTTIYDFTLERNELGQPLYWTSYYVLDLDRDGQNELAFVISDKAECFPATVLFTLLDEEVYAYTETMWQFEDVFTDSTIVGNDSGAANSANYYRITGFGKDGYETETLAYGDGFEHIFAIGKKNVSEDAFWNYISSMVWDKEKARVQWANVDVMYPSETTVTYEKIIKEAEKCLGKTGSIHIGVSLKLSNVFLPEKKEGRELGYLIEDIDGDGAEELIIGETVTNESGSKYINIVDMFTTIEGTTTQILNASEDISYRLCEDSLIAKEKQLDDGVSGISYYALNNGNLCLIESLVIRHIGNDSLYLYSDHLTYELFENDSLYDIISEEKMNNLMKKYIFEEVSLNQF